MSLVTIPYIPANAFGEYLSIDNVSAMLGKQQIHQLIPASWSKSLPNVSAAFTMAYGDDCLYLKYYVTEPVVRATYHRPNEPVYKDSCVEFFIAFDDDINYYNLEFNCAGTCLAQYGSNRDNRQFISANLLKGITHLTVLRAIPDKGITWELSLAIPLEVFKFHPLLKLPYANARINVFKCGDELEQPHHLCWGQIESNEPNFHRIEYFNCVNFTLSKAFSVD